MKTRVLTGITTTGTPHLGNYVGAIRPAVAASQRDDVDAFYFMADYHALIKSDDPARIERSRLEIAATWLAAGLDPQSRLALWDLLGKALGQPVSRLLGGNYRDRIKPYASITYLKFELSGNLLQPHFKMLLSAVLHCIA